MSNETENITTWKAMLSVFKDLTDGNPPVEKVKSKLLELEEAAKVSGVLTFRQMDAIHSRVHNYINGTFGKDAKKDAYTQPSASK